MANYPFVLDYETVFLQLCFNKKSITERKESYAEYFDIEDNKVLSIDDLKITLKNNNSHSIESFMIKVESPDFKIVYTSDIGTSNLDELVEVTPNNIRIRKKILNTEERKKYDARKLGK